MSDQVEENEGQPSGVNIEKTLAVVSNILADNTIATEVIEHNGWDHRLVNRPEQVAILFLASRYQWSVELLSTQTATLKKELDELRQRVALLENSGN